VINIHNHLLPNLDDGAMDDSTLEMCRIAAADRSPMLPAPRIALD